MCSVAHTHNILTVLVSAFMYKIVHISWARVTKGPIGGATRRRRSRLWWKLGCLWWRKMQQLLSWKPMNTSPFSHLGSSVAAGTLDYRKHCHLYMEEKMKASYRWASLRLRSFYGKLQRITCTWLMRKREYKTVTTTKTVLQKCNLFD